MSTRLLNSPSAPWKSKYWRDRFAAMLIRPLPLVSWEVIQSGGDAMGKAAIAWHTIKSWGWFPTVLIGCEVLFDWMSSPWLLLCVCVLYLVAIGMTIGRIGPMLREKWRFDDESRYVGDYLVDSIHLQVTRAEAIISDDVMSPTISVKLELRSHCPFSIRVRISGKSWRIQDISEPIAIGHTESVIDLGSRQTYPDNLIFPLTPASVALLRKMGDGYIPSYLRFNMVVERENVTIAESSGDGRELWWHLLVKTHSQRQETGDSQ